MKLTSPRARPSTLTVRFACGRLHSKKGIQPLGLFLYRQAFPRERQRRLAAKVANHIACRAHIELRVDFRLHLRLDDRFIGLRSVRSKKL